MALPGMHTQQLTGLMNEGFSSLLQMKSCLCWRGRTYTKNQFKSKHQEKTSSAVSRNHNILSHKLAKEDLITTLPKDWFILTNVPNTHWLRHQLQRRHNSTWAVSHVSAESFFQNKYGTTQGRRGILQQTGFSAEFTKGLRWNSYNTSRSKLMFLEEVANQQTHNPNAQADYLKAVVNEDPDYVIRRFESGKFASNEDVKEMYMKALLLTNRLTFEEAQRRYTADSNANSSNTNSSFFGSNSPNSPWRFQSGGGGGGGPTVGMFGQPSGSEEQPVHVVMNSKKGSFFKEQFWNTIRFAVLVGVLLYGFTYMQTKMMNVNQKEILPDQTDRNYKFSDVQGCDEAKQELQEVVEFLKSPEKFEKLGAKLPCGVLLIGPPGTGKTLLARAIAGEADVPFFFTSGSEFDEMFVGVGASRVRKLFAAAKEHSPCIIFIDELDAIGGTRVSNDHQPYSRMTLNQLLVELDGFDQTEGVIVIGATNFPEILDKALTRPGRFDSKVFVTLPDVRGRKEILKLYLNKSRISDNVDAEVLARGTPGFSGADLYNLVNQAALRAASLDQPLVSHEHFEWAKDKILMGPERKSAVIGEKNRTLVAYHESGHAVVALFTEDALPVHKATVIPRGSALGYVMQLPEKDELSWSKKQLLAKMDVCMGGRVAEEMIFGEDSITTGASSDMQQATKIARAMVTQYGMSDKVGTVLIDEREEKLSPELQSLIETEVKRLINDAYNRAKQVLYKRSKEHKRLAEGLLKYETLDASEIQLVMQGKALQNR